MSYDHWKSTNPADAELGSTEQQHPTDRAEDQIVQRIVWDALGTGHVISVCDGEEFPLRASTDETAIRKAIRSTDSDTLFFYRADDLRNRVGWVQLIWGNGTDVISDYSDNAATNAILAGATKLSNELEA